VGREEGGEGKGRGKGKERKITRRRGGREGQGSKNSGYGLDFYRAMHFSANARSWDRMSPVCPSVRPSVRL